MLLKSGFKSLTQTCSRTIQTSGAIVPRGRITVDAREKELTGRYNAHTCYKLQAGPEVNQRETTVVLVPLSFPAYPFGDRCARPKLGVISRPKRLGSRRRNKAADHLGPGKVAKRDLESRYSGSVTRQSDRLG